jgi:hypothetical protein
MGADWFCTQARCDGYLAVANMSIHPKMSLGMPSALELMCRSSMTYTPPGRTVYHKTSKLGRWCHHPCPPSSMMMS